MNKQTSFNHQRFERPSLDPENIDYLYRKCRSCGKGFIAEKVYFVCCTWQCSHDHEKAMHKPDPLDAAYQGHPF